MTNNFVIDPKIKEKITLAIDVDDMDYSIKLIEELKDYVGVFKFGLQFYTNNGNNIKSIIEKYDLNCFLDVKLMDIPNTVGKAAANIVKNGFNFFNLHALGGKEMMKQAVENAKKNATKDTVILAVTLLTSIDNEVLNNELSIDKNVNEYALYLAKLAKESGTTGVVASAFEARKIKEACGQDFKVLCPGIRLPDSNDNDQKRIATPKFAIEEGVDYLVIGRAVTEAENRVEAMQKIYQNIMS